MGGGGGGEHLGDAAWGWAGVAEDRLEGWGAYLIVGWTGESICDSNTWRRRCRPVLPHTC